MSDEETHEESEEIVFKEDAPSVTASPQMVTKSALDEIAEGWNIKFHQLSEGMRAIQKASCAASENFHTRMDELQKDSCVRDEKFHTHMDDLQKDSCVRDGAQERRIIKIQEDSCACDEKFHTHMDDLQRDSCACDGAQERRIIKIQEVLAQFLEKCDPTHLAAARLFDSPCAPMMSTPFTPSGAPSRLRPDFDFESPVNQSAPTESTRDNRERRDNRDHHDNRNTRDRSRDHRSNERPTHDDDRGDRGSTPRRVTRAHKTPE